MQAPRIRITLDLSESDFQLLEHAAERAGTSTPDYARYATLRRAKQDVELDSSQRSSGRVADPAPTRRSLRRVIQAAPIATPQIAQQLREFLGPQLLRLTLDADVAAIDSWIREKSKPSEVHERRLREAHEAWQLVCMMESPETTRAWWMGMKDALDDLSPAEAIALDRGRSVMSVARAYVESG